MHRKVFFCCFELYKLQPTSMILLYLKFDYFSDAKFVAEPKITLEYWNHAKSVIYLSKNGYI